MSTAKPLSRYQNRIHNICLYLPEMNTMRVFSLLVMLFCLGVNTFSQELSGKELLDKAITYHDPDGKWPMFSGTLNVTMKTPDQADRESVIRIDLPKEFFSVTATRNGESTTYTLNRGKCSTSIEQPDTSASRTPCETAELYRNYYTYLYGLPMKLKDPGTHISKTVERRNFKGKEYLVLNVTYDEAVGSDVWFFYFNPDTYAMEVYQFFKGDPAGEGKDTGEYILLTEELNINGLKLPQNRAWYYNKDDKYLGTDFLKK